MNKVWIVATVAIAIGLGIVFLPTGSANSQIEFTDVETECRLGSNHETHIELRQDNTLRFEGNYPVNNPDADIKTSFKRTGNLIELKVTNTDEERPTNFEGTCLGSVKYLGSTEPVPEGTYFLEVYHNDRQVRRSVLQVE